MIYCMNCKTEITPEHTHDDIGYPIDVCPVSPAHEIEEKSKCDRCGNPAEYLEKYCETCKQVFREAIHGQENYFVGVYGFDRSELKKIEAEIAEE